MKIHLVFYISLLESAPENVQIAENVEIANDTEQEYEVEKILRKYLGTYREPDGLPLTGSTVSLTERSKDSQKEGDN